MNEKNSSQNPNLPKAPNCIKCAYFKVTWEAAHPRACLVFGIKTRNLPSIEVFQATKKHCPAFQEKISEKNKISLID
jgi:hypothetical protein